MRKPIFIILCLFLFLSMKIGAQSVPSDGESDENYWFIPEEFFDFNEVSNAKYFEAKLAKNDKNLLRNNPVKQKQDTLEIEELVDSWRKELSTGALDTSKTFFVISKTQANNQFNYGIFWPSGSLINLPRHYVLETVEVERKRDGRLVLTWFEKEGSEYNLFSMPLPKIEIPDEKLPLLVEIKAIY